MAETAERVVHADSRSELLKLVLRLLSFAKLLLLFSWLGKLPTEHGKHKLAFKRVPCQWGNHYQAGAIESAKQPTQVSEVVQHTVRASVPISLVLA